MMLRRDISLKNPPANLVRVLDRVVRDGRLFLGGQALYEIYTTLGEHWHLTPMFSLHDYYDSWVWRLKTVNLIFHAFYMGDEYLQKVEEIILKTDDWVRLKPSLPSMTFISYQDYYNMSDEEKKRIKNVWISPVRLLSIVNRPLMQDD